MYETMVAWEDPEMLEETMAAMRDYAAIWQAGCPMGKRAAYSPNLKGHRMQKLRTPLRRRAAATLAVLTLAALGLSAVAQAANPTKGKTYTGAINIVVGGKVVTTFPISFAVSQSGTKVQKFALPSNVPIYCEGGGFGGGSAAVTNAGTFKLKLPIIFTPTHEHQGFATITGKFKPNKRESGTIATEFTKAKSCNGSSKYSTTAE
ncbi:MAG: hypothetical protein H0X42_05300 [Solirubrobacterales bacterium]|nr:hypothetical protein [Solirubrobacterales bacterium]